MVQEEFPSFLAYLYILCGQKVELESTDHIMKLKNMYQFTINNACRCLHFWNCCALIIRPN
ncbi:hypothetical protein DPMN_086206 [Dreissena polymorpha]|uniref:Uncharacterized protein n=1 Tax=Dreissena polymorpha TaxID=45954 RepID=A0A9D4BDH5_DREPO|nr:hypothetical protein DPMN_086206 [Dreissena polymorpha]